jgi:PhnB protein
MFQVYVNGSGKAFEFYKKAFDAEVVYQPPYDKSLPIDDVWYDHSELNVYGQILAVSEAKMLDYPDYKNETPLIYGNNVQLCLNFNREEADKVKKAYEVLSEDAIKPGALESADYSPCIFCLTDKFGVSWCLFTE